MCRTLVGILTGPLTLKSFSLAPQTKSVQAIQKKTTQKQRSKPSAWLLLSILVPNIPKLLTRCKLSYKNQSQSTQNLLKS